MEGPFWDIYRVLFLLAVAYLVFYALLKLPWNSELKVVVFIALVFGATITAIRGR